MFSSKASSRLCLTAVGLIIVCAAFFLPRQRLRGWRAGRYASRASALAASGSLSTAREACLRALALDRNCLPATRELLDLLPAGDLESALLLRSRVADLDPSDHSNLEKMIGLALAVRRFDLATKALRDLERTGGVTSKVLELRANILLTRGNWREANEAARRLLERQPQNVTGRLIAALAQVYSGEFSRVAERELLALSDIQTVRLEALRGLREAALRRGDRKEALEYAQGAAASPRSLFDDWMARADLAVQADASCFNESLAALTTRAGSDPQALGWIAKWIQKCARADQLDEWIKSSEALRRDPITTQMIRADSLMARGAWQEIEPLLAGQNWGPMDFLREAVQARAARASKQENAFIERWTKAVDASLAKPVTARTLANYTDGWPEWRDEADLFLWKAAERGPAYAAWALPDLQRHSAERRDTPALFRVAEAMCRFNPDSDPARNNQAFYSLLLHAGPERAHRTADELYAKYPDDAAIVSTRALSLLIRKHPAEALECLEKLPPTIRESAEIAPYYALALASTGNAEQAGKVLAKVRMELLLPEEQALLRQAKL